MTTAVADRPLEKVVGQILSVETDSIRPFVGQPREHFDEAKLNELANSIFEIGQVQPIDVRRIDPPENGISFEIIDGERRWRACKLKGIKEMKVIIDPTIPITEQYTRSLVANCLAEPHATYEMAWAIRRLKQKEGKSIQDICKIFGGKSEPWVYQYLRLFELHPRVLELMKPGISEEKRLRINTALLLLELPQECQLGPAEIISEQGLSATQAKELIRNTAHSNNIVLKDRSSDDLKTAIRALNKANMFIETLVSNPDERLRALTKNKNPEQVTKLKRLILDSRDNLTVLVDSLKDLEGE